MKEILGTSGARYTFLLACVFTAVVLLIGHAGTLVFDGGPGTSSHCRWIFDKYRPSEWEEEWTVNIEQLKGKVCETLAKPEESLKSQALVGRVQQLMAPNNTGPYKYDPATDDLFSRQSFRYMCADGWAGFEMETLIEPLIGNTRDPLTMCSGNPLPDPRRQSKNHLLMGASSPFRIRRYGEEWGEWTVTPQSQDILPPLHRAKLKHRLLLFDLGSSLFLSWHGKSSSGSTAYFVDRFARERNFTFDRIFAFEFEKKDPQAAWDQVPDDMMGIYTFINVGVQADGKYNPWRLLRRMATPEDYVVVKLDIDTPEIENSLMQQLRSDKSLLALVDEMTYEHHVTIPEMIRYWGTIPGLTLSDTYEQFLELRRHGIRMHSWP